MAVPADVGKPTWKVAGVRVKEKSLVIAFDVSRLNWNFLVRCQIPTTSCSSLRE